MHSLIFHVDVNSAFLSWESAKRLRDNPDALDLRTINAVIGGDEKMRHGVVLAKSPSAKKYGIMTGEPLSHARQKCPDLVIVPPDHDACVEMELLGHDFYVFINAETEDVNVVYKRKGNTYGLIEPEY